MTEEYAYGMWVIAAFNVGLFLFFFLSFLPPKGFAEWRSLYLMMRLGCGDYIGHDKHAGYAGRADATMLESGFQ